MADALQFTPSAVSQQVAVLEREAGLTLLERAGRGVRLTDAALVLVGHAGALLERVELAQADLAAAAGTVAGRGRIASFQSVAMRLAVPALEALARTAPGLRCELVGAEPEQSLPALALGDVDLVLSEDHPAACRHPDAVPLVELAGAAWTTGHRDSGWEEMTMRTCRELGGFEPDIHHRTNDSVTSLAVVAHGQAVTLLPRLVAADTQPGVAVRAIAEGSVLRTIFAATRTADAERPSVQALLGAVHNAAANAGWQAEEPDG